MSRVLATFSGKFGDILWALPTVRELTWKVGPVELGIMPQYISLLPLLNRQPYIERAEAIENWRCEGSPYGDQPWEAPVRAGKYEIVYHLTYRRHPVGMSLMQWTAMQVGIQLENRPGGVLPFIHVGKNGEDQWEEEVVAWAFNDSDRERKTDFVKRLEQVTERKTGIKAKWINVQGLSWVDAARVIRRARFFVGCRSSNYVLAHGLGQRVLCFEPNPARRGPVFGCPYGQEVCPEVQDWELFEDAAVNWMMGEGD